MKRILYLSLKIFSILVFAGAIAAASLLYGKPSHGADISVKTTSPPDLMPAAEEVIINEVMSSNNKYYTSDGSTSNDWVELYNTTGKDISLENFALTDSNKKLDKWPFPEVQIKAHGYLVISLTGDITSDIAKESSIVHLR